MLVRLRVSMLFDDNGRRPMCNLYAIVKACRQQIAQFGPSAVEIPGFEPCNRAA